MYMCVYLYIPLLIYDGIPSSDWITGNDIHDSDGHALLSSVSYKHIPTANLKWFEHFKFYYIIDTQAITSFTVRMTE